ncbi:MAG: phosphoribosyltransferase [Aquabacterium sp.]
MLPPYEVHWHPPGAKPPAQVTAFQTHYPVPLHQGGVLELPLRALPGGQQAIALLMSNQTPFEVEDTLANQMTSLARPLKPQMVAAVPTMGLDYARRVARSLQLPHYVSLGLSRKFWYDEALSEPVVSSTSPDQAKRLYLDPALLSRVAGRRVLLVDDVINTGASAAAAIRLLQRAGAEVCGLVVALTEGHAWREPLSPLLPHGADDVHAAGYIPLFQAEAHGRWSPIAETR